MQLGHPGRVDPRPDISYAGVEEGRPSLEIERIREWFGASRIPNHRMGDVVKVSMSQHGALHHRVGHLFPMGRVITQLPDERTPLPGLRPRARARVLVLPGAHSAFGSHHIPNE